MQGRKLKGACKGTMQSRKLSRAGRPGSRTRQSRKLRRAGSHGQELGMQSRKLRMAGRLYCRVKNNAGQEAKGGMQRDNAKQEAKEGRHAGHSKVSAVPD